jgi:hypothetical protein
LATVATLGVLGAEHLLADRDRAPVERLGLGPGCASLVVERRLVQERGGRPQAGPEPLGPLGRRERVRQERADRGPVGVIPGGRGSAASTSRAAVPARASAVASSSPSRVTAWTRRWT